MQKFLLASAGLESQESRQRAPEGKEPHPFLGYSSKCQAQHSWQVLGSIW